MGPVLQVRGLTKRFAVRRTWRDMVRSPVRGRQLFTAVDQVSFAVHPSEFFGLLGANGAGKTTLFKMLATHLLPDSGSALVAGHDVTTEPRRVRRLLTAVVADERSLHWRLTARQNLALFAALYGLRGEAAAARIREVLGTVELADDRRIVGSYSSGMKQRLLIARALLPRPRVLLLDEPTRSLDPVSARRFRRFLREEIAGRQQCAVVLATHDADEAFELCDRVAVLHHGRILALGPAARLAREVADDRFALHIRVEDRAALSNRLLAGGLEEPGFAPDEEVEPGWLRADLHVAGGAAGVADLVAALVQAGIRVARVEPVRPTLADLLERVIATAARESPRV